MPPPDGWLESRICEEFGCTPVEAVQQPLGLTLRIMTLRAYARAKHELDHAKDESEVTGSMVDWVWRVRKSLLRKGRT